MSEIEITVSAGQLAELEQLREALGLPSVEELATWLLKTRVREQMERVAGHRRALYEITGRKET